MLHSKVFLDLVKLQHSFNLRDSFEKCYGAANFNLMFCKIPTNSLKWQDVSFQFKKHRLRQRPTAILQIKGEFFAV